MMNQPCNRGLSEAPKIINKMSACLLLNPLTAMATCLGADSQNLMAEALYQDTDLRNFVCQTVNCTIEHFSKNLEFEPFDVTRNKDIEGCKVESTVKVRNMYTAIFLTNRVKPTFQTLNYGNLKISNSYRNGARRIYIQEPSSDSTFRETAYEWNGSNYRPLD